MKTIVEYVAHFACEKPDYTAVIAEEEKITYAELWREVRGFAAYLRSLGFPKGSRVVIKATPSIWFAVSAFAAHLAGYVNVPLEKTVARNGLFDVAKQLSASVVISDFEHDDKYTCIDSSSVRELANKYFSENLEFDFPKEDDICDILFTTGTTGKSKGVMESHRAVVAVVENVRYGASVPDNNVYLVPVPINHAGAIRKLYVSMMTGTTVVLLDGFTNIRKFYHYLEEYKVTSVLMPPSAVRMLLVLSAKELAKFSDQLDHIHTGSSSFPEADKEKLCEILPHTRLYYGYGSSEAGCSCLFDYSKQRGLVCCVGRPNVNSTVLIVDENHNQIKGTKDNPGLIAVTGPTVMSGYFNEPELTAGSLVDGVIYTNDLGYIDDDGLVYVLGRRDDVINIGGLKIAPTEVESIVLRYPGIAECACFAVEDRMGGSVPKLNVVAESGKTVDPTDLRRFMAEYLEAFKIPKLIAFVDEIPKTFNGKINRKLLK